MRTLAAGNKARPNTPVPQHPPARGLSALALARGVTLLELLVVLALMALTSAGAVLALRDSPQHRLDLEAQQLVTWLEAARAQARTRGLVVRWVPVTDGHVLQGLPPDALPALGLRWRDPDTRVLGGPLVLGPEPLLTAQTVVLQHASQPAVQVRIGTDGVRPFRLLP
jgi:general secretion pathway protein H